MRLRKGRDDFSAKQIDRAASVVKAHIAEHHLAKQGVDAGLFLQVDEIVPDRSGRTSNPMGHPLGATGAMILGTVLDELERRDKETALVTLCIGVGMGTATIIERV